MVRPHVCVKPAVTAANIITTLTAAVPFCPSLVAVIVAGPAATAVTNPVGLTRATPVSLVAHVTVRPVTTLPLKSLVVAVSCSVLSGGMANVAGNTVTEATGAGAEGMPSPPPHPDPEMRPAATTTLKVAGTFIDSPLSWKPRTCSKVRVNRKLSSQETFR